MTLLSTVIENNKDLMDSYFKSNAVKKRSSITSWAESPSYSDFQTIVIEILDLSNKTSAFTDFKDFTDLDEENLKNKVLTLLALSLNFSDLMNYDFEKWLRHEG